MRIVWLLGGLAMTALISTANARPAPAPDAPLDAAAAPAPDAPLDAAADPAPAPSPPSEPPGAGSLTPAPSAPPRMPSPGATGAGRPPEAGFFEKPEPEPEPQGYGWQIAMADVASTAIVFSNNENTLKAGLVMYALSGPIIHGAHHQGGRALASLTLRVGLPVVSAMAWGALSNATTHCAADDDDCGDAFGAVLVGFGLGVITAMVIDDALLAHPVKARQTPGVTWVPQVAVTPRRVGLGVLARF